MILGTMENGVSWVKNGLRFSFELTDLGETKHYLEATFGPEGNVMIVYQAGYCRRILDC